MCFTISQCKVIPASSLHNCILLNLMKKVKFPPLLLNKSNTRIVYFIRLSLRASNYYNLKYECKPLKHYCDGNI